MWGPDPWFGTSIDMPDWLWIFFLALPLAAFIL
jgi:hypothetical protein